MPMFLLIPQHSSLPEIFFLRQKWVIQQLHQESFYIETLKVATAACWMKLNALYSEDREDCK